MTDLPLSIRLLSSVLRLELAVLRISVAVLLQHLPDGLEGDLSIRSFLGADLIPVLDRMLVRPEREGAAGQLGFGGEHGFAECFGIIYLAAGCFECRA